MNKEEILSKSKKENLNGDEREKAVRTSRDAFSVWGFIILGFVIIIMKITQGQSPADIISLFFCVSGIGFTYEGIQEKNKWHIVSGVVLLLFTAYFFYKFYKGLF